MRKELPAETEGEHELTLPEISSLLVRINLFSQGEKTLVEELLAIVASEKPGWRMPERRIDMVVDQLKHRFNAIVQNRSLHKAGIDPTSVELELESQLTHMAIVFNDQPTPDAKEQRFLIEEALVSIAEREHRYLVCERRRPRFGKPRQTVMHDPHASYILHYMVRRHSTGNAALDAMCAKMGELIQTPEAWLDRGRYHRFTELMNDVIAAYNDTHTDDQWGGAQASPTSADGAAEAM